MYLQPFNALQIALVLYGRIVTVEAIAPPEMMVFARIEVV